MIKMDSGRNGKLITSNQKGATLVWMVIVVLLSIIVASIVIDVSLMIRTAGKVQSVCDASALAGVDQLPDTDLAIHVIEKIAASNGYIDSNDGASINISFDISKTYKCTVLITAPTRFYMAPVFGMQSADLHRSATAEAHVPVMSMFYGSFPFALIDPELNNDPTDDLVSSNYGKRYIIGYGEDNVIVADWADGYGPIPPVSEGSGRGWRGALGLKKDGTIGSDAGADDILDALGHGWSGTLEPEMASTIKTGDMTSAVRDGRILRLGYDPISWNDFNINQHRKSSRVVFVPIVHLINVNSNDIYTVQDWNNGTAWNHDQVVIRSFAPFFLLSKTEQGDVNGDGNTNDVDWLTGYFIPGIEVPVRQGSIGGLYDNGLYISPRLIE